MLEKLEELLPGQFDVVQDAAQKTWRDIFAAMDRDDSRSSIGMPKIEMAPFLTDAFKANTFENANQFIRFENG